MDASPSRNDYFEKAECLNSRLERIHQLVAEVIDVGLPDLAFRIREDETVRRIAYDSFRADPMDVPARMLF